MDIMTALFLQGSSGALFLFLSFSFSELKHWWHFK
jgi:hypothetical protein